MWRASKPAGRPKPGCNAVAPEDADREKVIRGVPAFHYSRDTLGWAETCMSCNRPDTAKPTIDGGRSAELPKASAPLRGGPKGIECEHSRCTMRVRLTASSHAIGAKAHLPSLTR